MKSEDHPNLSRLTSRLPKGLSDEELNALAEMARGPTGAGGDAHVQNGLLADLRTDASMLREARALGGEHRVTLAMSATIAAGVESRLNEAAVQELLAAEQTATPWKIPMVSRPPSEQWRLRTAIESPVVRRMSIAAALVLCAGGGWLVLQGVQNAWNKHSRNELASNANHGHSSANAKTNTANESGNGSLASTDNGTQSDDAMMLASTDANAGNPATVNSTVQTHPAAVASAKAGVPMTMERAAQLAAEGRLVLRVRTLSADNLTKRLEIVSRQRELAGQSMRAVESAQTPAQFATLWTPTFEGTDSSIGSPHGPSPSPIWVAGMDGNSAPSGVVTPAHGGIGDLLGMSARKSEVRAVYLAEVAPSEAEIEQLKRLVASAAASASVGMPANKVEGFELGVVLEELPADEAGAMREPEMDVDPADVLWWTNTPSQWAKHPRVPVVIETLTK